MCIFMHAYLRMIMFALDCVGRHRRKRTHLLSEKHFNDGGHTQAQRE